MDELKLALLKESNTERIGHLIKKLNVDEVYREFCEFYEKCEILHIEIAAPVRKYIVNSIMKYRWRNLKATTRNKEDDIPGRIQLVLDILDENLNDFSVSLDDEKFHLLMFLARIMNVLNGEKQRKVPWMELKFMLCIFVATKTDKYHTKYPFIDIHFQFLVDEEFILKNLEKLLQTLKNKTYNEKWTDLKKIYKATRYYYEMQKVRYHLERLELSYFDNYLQNEQILKRHFQQIGESLKAIEKIGISKEKFKSDELIEFFSFEKLVNSFITMRNPLSHVRDKSGGDATNVTLFVLLKIGMVKMDIIILDLVHVEQILILNDFITKLIKEDCSEKLLSKIDQIDTHQINNWEYKSVGNDKREWFVNFIKTNVVSALNNMNQINNELIKQSEEVIDAWELLKVANESKYSYHLIAFFRSAKNRLSVIQNIQRKLKNISKNKDNFKSNQVNKLCDASAKLYSFIFALPDISENDTFFLMVSSLYSNLQLRLIEKTINKSDNFKIETVLDNILKCINNSSEKRKFNDIKHNLIIKRQLCNDYNYTRDLNSIKEKWPKNDETIIWNDDKVIYDDPLEIISNNKENLSEYRVVEKFLKKIDFGNSHIVNEIKNKERTNLKTRLNAIKKDLLKKGNQFTNEMTFLEVFEISKLLEIEFIIERNYMDNFCLLPMGRPLRNFIAHSDIYMDLFLKDKETIVEYQLQELFELDVEKKLDQGIFHIEDFSYMKGHFYEQKGWIQTFIGQLKINAGNLFPLGSLSEENIIMSLRVKDVHELTFVHHNLKKLDRNNKFFMYLIDNLTSKNDFQVNDVFEIMLEESKTYKEVYLDSGFITKGTLEAEAAFKDYLIDDLINEPNDWKKRLILCFILCFNCPETDVFKKLYREFEQYSEKFIKCACSFKQVDIVKYIIEDRYLQDESVLKETLDSAILVDNFELASYVIERSALTNGANSLEFASRRANLDMIKLLIENGAELDYSSIYNNYLHQFDGISICEYLVAKHPDLINHNNSQLIFEACYWRNEELVRFLVEKGANLNSIRNGLSVLMVSCFYFNDYEIVKYLVEKGASTHSETNINVLVIACLNDNIEIAKFLLEKGAKPFVGCGSISPLDKAIKQQSYKLTEILLKGGAKINENTDISNVKPSFFKYLINKETSIDWIVNSLDVVILIENVELLKEMLNHLKKMEHKLNFGNFMGAFRCKEIFNLLLEYPYQNLSKLEWSELLYISLVFLDSKELRFIISKGADINYKDNSSNSTILHIFFSFYNLFDNSMLRFLLNNEADIDATDKNQRTPIQIAEKKLDEHSFQEVVKIIQEIRGTN